MSYKNLPFPWPYISVGYFAHADHPEFVLDVAGSGGHLTECIAYRKNASKTAGSNQLWLVIPLSLSDPHLVRLVPWHRRDLCLSGRWDEETVGKATVERIRPNCGDVDYQIWCKVPWENAFKLRCTANNKYLSLSGQTNHGFFDVAVKASRDSASNAAVWKWSPLLEKDVNPLLQELETASISLVGAAAVQELALLEDPFVKLNLAYHKAMASALKNGGHLQVFTPMRAISKEEDGGDYDVLAMIDRRPDFALVSKADIKDKSGSFAPTPIPGGGFYAVYGSLLGDVKLPEDINWQDKLKGHEAAWSKFLEEVKPLPDDFRDKLVAFLKSKYYTGWNAAGILRAYDQAQLDDRGLAITKYTEFSIRKPIKLREYYNNSTHKVVSRKIDVGQKLDMTFASTDVTSDRRNTWAEGTVKGAYNMFSVEVNAQYQKLSETILSCKINVEVTMDKHGTVPIYSHQGNWFHLPVMLRTRHKDEAADNFKDTRGWTRHYDGEGTIKGDLLYTASDVILAKGVTVKTKIESLQKKVDMEELRVAVKTGFWPFFQAESKGGFSHVSVDEHTGNVTIETSPNDKTALFAVGCIVHNTMDL